jgi:hypothetical protein
VVPQRADRWVLAGLGVRYGGGRGDLHGARAATLHASARALAPGAPAQFQLTPFHGTKLHIFEQKWSE